MKRAATGAVAAALAALLVVASAGCSHAVSGPDLGRLLLPSPGAGYSLVDAATGPVPAATAAAATAAAAPAVRDYLDRSGFRAGYAKVWRGTDGFVTALAFRFASAGGAAGLPGALADALRTSRATRRFTDRAIPGSVGLVLTSGVQGRVYFCVSELFAVSTVAYDVTRCTSYPQDTATVTRLAGEQHARATS